jgi:hypothetical protein
LADVDVDVTFRMQPEHMGQIERHARRAGGGTGGAAAIKHCRAIA